MVKFKYRIHLSRTEHQAFGTSINSSICLKFPPDYLFSCWNLIFGTSHNGSLYDEKRAISNWGWSSRNIGKFTAEPPDFLRIFKYIFTREIYLWSYVCAQVLNKTWSILSLCSITSFTPSGAHESSFWLQHSINKSMPSYYLVCYESQVLIMILQINASYYLVCYESQVLIMMFMFFNRNPSISWIPCKTHGKCNLLCCSSLNESFESQSLSCIWFL